MRWLCVCVLLAAAVAGARAASRECNLKQIAFSAAQAQLPERAPLVDAFDALQLSAQCGFSRPAAAARDPLFNVMAGAPSAARATPALQIFVDGANGADSNAGTLSAPLKSVTAAVKLSRTRAANTPAEIVLRAGTYYLSAPIQLGAADSFLTIRNMAGEQVVLSGGAALTGLQWSSAGGGVFVADVSALALPVTPTQLFVDGRRAIRARYPNANPETQGVHTANSGYASAAGWLSPPNWGSSQVITISSPRRPSPVFNTFSTGVGGPCKIYSPPQGYWCGNPYPNPGQAMHTLPSGLTLGSFSSKSWANPTTGVVHAWHCSSWENWQFNISSRSGNTIRWDYGGFQGARGCSTGGAFFIENIFEELDVPNEFFFDAKAQKLYFYPNTSNANWQSSKFEVSQLESVVKIVGSKSAPATHITLSGLTIAHTETTFLAPYEMPSGGDWSIHRGAAVFVEGAEDAVIENCLFVDVGGNAVFVSNYNRRATIRASEFAWLGDSAVAAVGTVQQNDGTDGNHPLDTLMEKCLVREVGIFGKQTSAFIQALAARSTVRNNVFFNGPRAGINFNDGFGGGSLVEHNIIFNMVRESGDHGCFNSWDRNPFVTPYAPAGQPANVPAVSQLRNNFFLCNYGCVWAIDHDDGSEWFNDSFNVLVWGGAKNFLGNNKKVFSNLYVFPDNKKVKVFRNGKPQLQAADWGSVCIQFHSDPGSDAYQDTFYNNTCVLGANSVVFDASVQASSSPLSNTNHYYTPNGQAQYSFGSGMRSLADMQGSGRESGSTVAATPADTTVFSWISQWLAVFQDPCASVNCGAHGNCSSGACVCRDGYTGSKCNYAPGTDPCLSLSCGAHGSCSDGACACTGGYTGPTCLVPPASTTICATATEGQQAGLTCPDGTTIAAVTFASYGLPSGSCPSFSTGSCHSSSSVAQVQSACVGKSSCSVAATNDVFGDPCSGTGKSLDIAALCTFDGPSTGPAPPPPVTTTICGTATEGQQASLSCPAGKTIKSITFASYGLPSGSCPSFTAGSCHASSSVAQVQSACVGKSSCSVAASNDVFGDPCSGRGKTLDIAATCA